MSIRVIYRLSDAGYKKEKPKYIDNKLCLENASKVFGKENIRIICDNCSQETIILAAINTECDTCIKSVSVGHGAGTFNIALSDILYPCEDCKVTYNDDDIIYFLENDYLHKPESPKIIEEGFSLGASFVSLYDHPDKYLDPKRGGNPYCEGGGEDTRVYLTESCHWKITNSTTMTFAAKVSTLKRVEPILRKWTSETHPNDFQMFMELRKQGELLVTPIPGYATHGESAWLSPLTDWSKI
mgnify:CR=1 FL=1|tara:strand:+ start:71 stop:793 length:723 start_codon:yes stop_codon:yes gene_type:complete